MSDWKQESVGNGTMIDHSGGRFLDREGLVGLYTPTATDTWKPVPHSELVDALLSGLDDHKIIVKDARYCVAGKNDARLFGLLDLEIPHLSTPEYGMVLGFRGANDKSLAIQATAGARVFICTNLAFAGDSGTIVLHKKHSTRLDLTRVVPPAIDAYLEKAGQFVMSIEDMKNYELSEPMAKEIIYDSFVADPVMNRRLWPYIHALYFSNKVQHSMFPDRTLWSLQNAYTQAAKSLPPVVQDNAGRAIGRFFSRVVNRDRKATALGWDVPADEDEEPRHAPVLAAPDFID